MLFWHNLCSCDCAGTCVGEQNRRKFAVYLFIQAVEGIVMISIATDAFTLQDNVDEWFKANWLYIIAWFSVFCVLLIAIPLFLYQAFLISTNQVRSKHGTGVLIHSSVCLLFYLYMCRLRGSTLGGLQSRTCGRCRTRTRHSTAAAAPTGAFSSAAATLTSGCTERLPRPPP